MTATESAKQERPQHKPLTVSLPTLTAMVVGSMVGAGVFSLPRRFAQETGVYGALIAWLIAGGGMLMLALVFQRLGNRKPKLDAGVYAYAKAGFGEYFGTLSAVGYWSSACVGNVTYWVLIFSTLGAWVPAFGAGDTVLAIVLSSIGLWLFYWLISRGIQSATAINRVVTVAKVIPIIVFVILALFVLDLDVFVDNLSGSSYGSLFSQVTSTMLVTVFVFLGVEGASVYSRQARKRSDVGKATLMGFVGVLAVFASVTIVSYGILPVDEIAKLQQPSMAGVLEAAVGPWGSVFVGIGLIVSVLGAYLAWTLMAAEVLFVAAKNQDLPRFLAKTNTRDVPIRALLMSSTLAQVVLIITYFSEDAFDFALDLTAGLTLIPFFLAAGYAVKLRVTRETYETASSAVLRADLIIAVLAAIYTAFLLYAAGLDLVLLGFLVYALASALFAVNRREQHRPAFVGIEKLILAVVVIGAVFAVLSLSLGWITL